MNNAITRIVIVGGGTAGWLAACRIAAAARPDASRPIEVTLVESPEVATIGVGEGTWPTMRGTLQRIGIGETDFLLACGASFKHGSRFVGWATGRAGDVYAHPFTPPGEIDARAAVAAWQEHAPAGGFADAVGAQPHVAGLGLAPRQRVMPDYAGALNYGYHLDAGKLAALLSRHATATLGVRHVRDHVVGIDRQPNGDVAAVRTREHGAIVGELFLECTGHAALLVGDVPFVDRGDVLFNDRALAVQVPVAEDSAIAGETVATAHAAGWIWDIGLPTRRGVGCVYSSAHMSDDEAAATLAAHLGDAAAGAPRRLAFRSGHRERFWHRNCLAIGLSAGFLEPLEASAIVTIELSLDALLDDWPTAATMPLVADRFNALFRYRWDRIVEFLKLHYLLSRRREPYWRDHRDAASVPPRLAELLTLWRQRPPTRADFPMIDEVFPAASYQYVLYGMGWPAPAEGSLRAPSAPSLAPVQQRARGLAAALPSIRSYLDACRTATQPPRMEQHR